jgi:hypothetical protein
VDTVFASCRQRRREDFREEAFRGSMREKFRAEIDPPSAGKAVDAQAALRILTARPASVPLPDGRF